MTQLSRVPFSRTGKLQRPICRELCFQIVESSVCCALKSCREFCGVDGKLHASGGDTDGPWSIAQTMVAPIRNSGFLVPRLPGPP